MIQDYLIGTQLDEYRLECLLGRGGMARVYRGLDVNLKRPAAIKVIDIPHRADAEYVERFKREAQAIARLDHPHIVRLYRYGEAKVDPTCESLLYMAMQFVQGADLDYVLKSYRSDGEFLEIQDASRIVREVCAALDYAHAQGIIHRDVKPSNIMLDSQGRVVLTDFGLALLSTQATRGEIFGSPQYVSPEQVVSSAKAVPQSDLYAVGVILYEMFTGVLPFDAKEPLEMALMHLNQPVPSPRKVRPELSAELEAVMLKALEKQPEDRYPTGQALSDAMDQALAEKPLSIPVRRVTLPQRVTVGLVKQDLQAASPPVQNPPTPEPVLERVFEPTLGNPPVKRTPLSLSLPRVVARNASATRDRVARLLSASRWSTRSIGKRIPISWIVGGLSSLMLLALCFLSSILLVNSPLWPRAKADSLASTGLVRPTATLVQVQIPTEARLIPTPEATWTAAAIHSIQISRQGEENGYFVLANTGETDIPLAQLSLRGEKSQLGGATWGLEKLPAEGCLLARKEDREGNGLPKSVSCVFSGHTVLVRKTGEWIFKEKVVVVMGERVVGTCAKEESQCTISFAE